MKIKIYQFIAHLLPNKLKYCAAIEVLNHCTAGKYEKMDASKVTAMDAIITFGIDKKVEG